MSGSLNDVLFRDYQINTLSAFLHRDPSITPPNLVIQGHSSTGKTFALKRFFETNQELVNAWLEPIELVTWKPLMQAVLRTVQNGLRSLYPEVSIQESDPLDVEETYLLVKLLTNLLSQYDSLLQEELSFFLVFDGLDQLNDLDAVLFRKLIKLHELLPASSKIQLKFVYTIQDMAFVERYSSHCLPVVVFPRYTTKEVTEILIATRADDLIMSDALREKVLKEGITECTDEQFLGVAINFIQLIVQSFHSYTGNNIAALNDLIDFKWDSFVDKVIKENIFEPLALYRAANKVFSSTGDTFSPEDSESAEITNEVALSYELSAISKYLLIAAYICSYLEPRYDSNVFSKKSHIKTGRASYGRRKKIETNPRFLQPSIFPLERLLAVFQAIFPVERKAQSGSLALLKEEPLMRANVEVFQNLAELHTLKLVSTTVARNIDFLNYKVKWKVNVPWEIINEIGRSVDFDVGQYFGGQ
ncbi:hypothetical protein HG536_0B01130 [Torulaspora globosa]|uniref:Uncharacterized protein n=1 Tax=Torulaspora globosa TaxID=48254 RepID=A0A7G3ZCL6_9SACH|nr:uncharacterized protein HG536_0B01130 [Torulaspora globosa]QLL31252.1 hypothetical protein HG536_0B01130 [Torulaspora globosa]